MKSLKYLILLLITVSPLLNLAQTKRSANYLFELENYEEALDEFLFLLKEDSLNSKYNYKVAVCYLNTNIDKSKAST